MRAYPVPQACRWIGYQVLAFLIVHGILFHALWASAGSKTYREEAFRFSYAHHFSNGAGLVAFTACIFIAVTVLPVVRRRAYWVCPRCVHSAVHML